MQRPPPAGCSISAASDGDTVAVTAAVLLQQAQAQDRPLFSPPDTHKAGAISSNPG